MAKVKVSVKIPASFGKPDKAVLKEALRAVSEFARDRIVQQAHQQLSPSTAQTYIRGMGTPESTVWAPDGLSVTLVLVGERANQIEKGAAPFDIKKGLLRNAGAKGYVDVPFRHSVPGSKGAVGRPMPRADYNQMRRVVDQARRAARASGASQQQAALQRVRGPRTMPTRPQTKRVGDATYRHKVSIFADMLHIPKLYQSAIQSHYMTFRRVSKNSDPNSWIHPGRPGAGIFEKVAPDIRSIAPTVVSDYLTSTIRIQ